jgi:hypothetical protein
MPVNEIASKSSPIEGRVLENDGNEKETRRSIFGLLWLGQTVSIIGSQFSSLSIR